MTIEGKIKLGNDQFKVKYGEWTQAYYESRWAEQGRPKRTEQEEMTELLFVCLLHGSWKEEKIEFADVKKLVDAYFLNEVEYILKERLLGFINQHPDVKQGIEKLEGELTGISDIGNISQAISDLIQGEKVADSN